MTVLSRPSIENVSKYQNADNRNKPFDALVTRRYEFFETGREGLLSGLIKIGLVKGDALLFPAYMCGPSLKPLKDYGFKIEFIDISKDLTFDPGALRLYLAQKNYIKAIVVVHYFGLPQRLAKIRDLCDEKELYLIEDCCHGFLSEIDGQFIGSQGDMSVFSFRKTFACHDGGAIMINSNSSESCLSVMANPNWFAGGWYVFGRFVEVLISKTRVVNIYSSSVSKVRKYASKIWQSFLFPLRRLQPSFSEKRTIVPSETLPTCLLKSYLKSSAYIAHVAYKRIENLDYMTNILESMGFSVLHNMVGGTWVPQYLVITNGDQNMVTFLRDKGIGATQWPGQDDIPAYAADEEFPNTADFAKSIVLLPLHQSLNKSDIERIIQATEAWRSQIN